MTMTPEMRANYERAAVALETHEPLTHLNGEDRAEPWISVAWKAWDQCNESCYLETVEAIDLAAARLLRDCIARGEPMFDSELAEGRE